MTTTQSAQTSSDTKKAQVTKKYTGKKDVIVTIHPDAGKRLTKTTARCRCGGTTGVCGIGDGSRQWKAHITTKKHKAWEHSYLQQQKQPK